MSSHTYFMHRCFELAEKGRGYTRSNPMVGALLVHNGWIVAEGFHAIYGGPHAEVNCIQQVVDKRILTEASLYVSLEPCNFQGKTPACTERILQSGIPRVIIGSADFNPRVRYQGMDYLRSQEVEVINLDWEERQKLLNISFFINQVKQEPYFVGKIAYSQDKIIGRWGEKLKITSPEIDVLGHKLRSEVDAILVGGRTWQNDQPSLTSRHYYSDCQPDILVWTQGTDCIEHTLDGRTIHMVSSNSPRALQEKIFSLGYRKVLVEGGAEVFRYFMNENLFHEFYCYENQSLTLKTGIPMPVLENDAYQCVAQNYYFQHCIRHFLRHDIPST